MASASPIDNRLNIVKQHKRNILLLAQYSTKQDLDPEEKRYQQLFNNLDATLQALENDKSMTPEFKQESQIDQILKVICDDARYHFPQLYAERAKALIDHFEAINWGGLEEIRDEEEGTSGDDSSGSEANRPRAPVAKRRKTSSTTKTNMTNVPGDYEVLQPPVNHPIWGKKGIMHGIALRRYPDGSLSKGLNPLYNSEKKDPKAHSHNGIQVGQWYPNRLAAIFAGAHGASQAGIPGSNGTGAYSVVVSGQYEDLDKDEGNIVYYSGSGSHENKDPNQPAKSTTGTRILHASLKHRRPIRLLRTSRAVLPWAPAEGLRYDGLYRVEAMDKPKNGNGGLYERFKLVRIAGQLSLDECRKRPTRQELRDFNQINHGYSGFGQSHLVK